MVSFVTFLRLWPVYSEIGEVMLSLARMQFVSIQESLPAVERMIAATVDRDCRNRLVDRLATLDQEAATLRDKLGEPGVSV